MANRRVNYSKTTPKRSKTGRKTSRKGRRSLSTLKYNVKLAIIWVLLAVNVILISSLVQRLIAQGPDKPHVFKGEALSIEVLNGCGKTGLAQSFADHLQRKGCQIVNVDNADSDENPLTILIDRERRNKSDVKKLCELVGLDDDRIISVQSESTEADVTLILGKDYESLKSYRQLR